MVSAPAQPHQATRPSQPLPHTAPAWSACLPVRVPACCLLPHMGCPSLQAIAQSKAVAAFQSLPQPAPHAVDSPASRCYLRLVHPPRPAPSVCALLRPAPSTLLRPDLLASFWMLPASCHMPASTCPKPASTPADLVLSFCRASLPSAATSCRPLRPACLAIPPSLRPTCRAILPMVRTI